MGVGRRSFPFGGSFGLFSVAFAVSFREGKVQLRTRILGPRPPIFFIFHSQDGIFYPIIYISLKMSKSSHLLAIKVGPTWYRRMAIRINGIDPIDFYHTDRFTKKNQANREIRGVFVFSKMLTSLGWLKPNTFFWGCFWMNCAELPFPFKRTNNIK